MEQIRVASLEIDTKKLITELQATKAGIAEITKEQKAMTAVGKDTSESFIRNEAHLKTLRSEYTKQIKTLQNVSDGNNKLNEGLKKEVVSVSGAIKNNKELRNIRNEINGKTKEGAAQIAIINKKIDENSKFVDDNGSKLEKLKNNVGNYIGANTALGRSLTVVQSVTGDLTGKFKTFGQATKQAGTQILQAGKNTKGLSAAQKASVITTNLLTGGLKLFKLALAATGIGLIVVALGALVSYFTKTQKGADQVSKVMGAVGAVMDVLIDRISAFGGAIVKFLSGDFAGGFDDMKTSLAGIGDELEREAKLAYDLEAAFITLQDKEIGLIEVQAKRKKSIEELRLAAKDENTSLKERAALLQEAGDIEKAGAADRVAIAKEDARISAEKLALGESSRDDVRANAELQAKVTELETASLKLQRSLETEKQGLIKRGNAEAKKNALKLQNDSLKRQKEGLALFIAQQGTRAKTIEEELKLAEAISKEKINILDAELKAGKISREKYETELLKIQDDLGNKRSDIAIDNAKRELDGYINANQSKLDSDKFFSDAALLKEQERLNGIAEQRRSFAALQLEEGVISQTEYNAAINEVNEENRVLTEDAKLKRSEAKAVTDAIDYENQLSLDIERLDFDLALTSKYIESERKAALADAKKTGADTALIDEQYNKIQLDNKRAVNQNKRDLASGTLGHLATVFGEETAAGKAAAVAQATIDTYSSAVSAFNSLSGIPVVGTVLGGIAAAAAVKSGITTVKKIISTPDPKAPQAISAPKAARGMMIGGKRHSQGGTLIEAEIGEAVMTRGAVAKHGALLSAINVDGGGIPFMENGGTIGGAIAGSNSVPTSMGIDYNKMAAAFKAGAESVTNVVSVDEINTVNARVLVAESASTL